jgi:hypothetical protein
MASARLMADSAPARSPAARQASACRVMVSSARRGYTLRSYVFCAQCRHRMFGKTRHTRSYFGCQPRETRRREEALRLHQKSVWVREDALLEGVLRFVAERVLGPDRQEHLRAELEAVAPDHDKALEKEAASLRRAVQDVERKKARLVKQLEEQDDQDGSVFRAVRERLSELTAERQQKLSKLGALLDRIGQGSDGHDDAAVLDDLPTARLSDLIDASEAVLRMLFDALRLRVVYDGRTGEADCTVTVTDDTLAGVWGAIAAMSAGDAADPPSGGLAKNGPTGAQGHPFPSAVRPRQDSNLRTRLRRPMLYPLSYEGGDRTSYLHDRLGWTCGGTDGLGGRRRSGHPEVAPGQLRDGGLHGPYRGRRAGGLGAGAGGRP